MREINVRMLCGVGCLAVTVLTVVPGAADEDLQAARRAYGHRPEAGAKIMPAPVNKPAPIKELIGNRAPGERDRDGERSVDEAVKAALDRQAIERITAIVTDALVGFDSTSFDKRFSASIRNIDAWLKPNEDIHDSNR